jgi:hypothetical protein
LSGSADRIRFTVRGSEGKDSERTDSERTVEADPVLPLADIACDAPGVCDLFIIRERIAGP